MGVWIGTRAFESFWIFYGSIIYGQHDHTAQSAMHANAATMRVRDCGSQVGRARSQD